MEQFLQGILPIVSEDKNRALLASYTREEVFQALKMMNPSKAPSPDGLTALFFHKFWHIVGDEVSSICLNILNDGEDISSLNTTVIVLIPKTKSAQRITEFRPISLCNVIYKIVSKTVANRLKFVLNEIISQNQSAFVSGRLITDNAILGYECIHSLRLKRRGRKGGQPLSLT